MASATFEAPSYEDMELNDILPHVKKAVKFLQDTDDYRTKSAKKALLFLCNVRSVNEPAITSEATKCGIGKLYVKISQNLKDELATTMEDKPTRGMWNLKTATNIFWEYADGCPDLGIDLGKMGAIDCVLTILKMVENQPDSKRKTKFVNSLLGILYNSIRHDECASNRVIYRKAGVVSSMNTWIESPKMNLKVVALLVLAFIIDEKESEMLGRDGNVIATFVGMLNTAVESSDHTADDEHASFSLEEIIAGLHRLIINDANKEIVWRSGGIPTITSMLTPDFTSDDQTMAAKVLWSLAFNENVRKSDDMKKSVEALTRLTSSNTKSVRTASSNALWQILDKSSQQKKVGGREHIMISYNWTHQDIALKVRDDLERAGYNVWIDVDKMEDDILETMASAVSKSAVVLVCMSQQYHNSQNCRSEATYAYKKKKHVIPLLMEDDYSPEGWLDILIGTKLYYKVSSRGDLQKNLAEIKRVLGNRGRGLGSSDEVDGPVTPKRAATTDTAPPWKPDASSWTTERVHEWFEEIKLPQLKALDFSDGSTLKVLYEDSDTLKETCRESGLKAYDVLRLQSALKKLFI
ncbi:uncharacterized protein [Amphiura filiformis]|uniref:uncharacterized protein n=1 Tax=Amphiura filiformis TaxID=82378 RepID=UPI003B211B96